MFPTCWQLPPGAPDLLQPLKPVQPCQHEKILRDLWPQGHSPPDGGWKSVNVSTPYPPVGHLAHVLQSTSENPSDPECNVLVNTLYWLFSIPSHLLQFLSCAPWDHFTGKLLLPESSLERNMNQDRGKVSISQCHTCSHLSIMQWALLRAPMNQVKRIPTNRTLWLMRHQPSSLSLFLYII